MKNPLLWVSLSAILLAVSGTVSAQDADDPPSRVARIAYLAGPVSFESGQLDQWADATVNYPMTTGDSLYTDRGGRAALRIGQNSIRVAPASNYQFVNLTDNVVQSSINAGSMSIKIRHLFDGESWEVDTPNVVVTVLGLCQFRVDTDPNLNFTMVSSRQGDVQIIANNQSFTIHVGQTAYFDDSGDPPEIGALGDKDDFDNFVVQRNGAEEVPLPQYVSAEMVGYEDLNANGAWRNTPDGPVWTPRVAAGWAPYHDGHWAWVAPWGWTWVDDAPWGFAPFHYGRWAQLDNTWVWYPGVVAPRPYYAPALVAFVGGGGFGASVGWFPLGPKEAYYPTYHVSPTYVRQVNVTNTRITNINVTNVNVTNITYVNRAAVVAVPQNSFVTAQPVRRAAVQMTAAQIQQGQVIGAAPKVAPQPQSVLGNSNGHKAAAPPAALANRPVVAKLAPPPAPVPFAAQQQILQQHPGAPVEKAQLQTLRTQSPPPARMQVKPIDTKQVHAITPVVQTTPAPPLAQRLAAPKKAPQAASAVNPRGPAAPAAATQNAPARGPAQPAPAARVETSPTAPKPVPPVPAAKAQPVAPKAPPAGEKAQPLTRPAPVTSAAAPKEPASPKKAAAPEAPAPKAEPAAAPKPTEAAAPKAAPAAAPKPAASATPEAAAAAPKTKKDGKKTEEKKTEDKKE